MSPKITSARNLTFIHQSLKDDWESELQSFELDILCDEKELATKRPYFILVPSIEVLKQNLGWDCKVFVTGELPTNLSELANGKFFAGRLTKSLFASDWGRSLLARSFRFPDSFVEKVKEEYPSFYRWSCPHLLSLGTYSDQIYIELVARGFKIDQVKSYFDELFFFYSKNIQSALIKPPFDIELVIFKEWFSLQMITHCEDYWFEYLESSMKNHERGEMASLASHSDALEVLFLRNSKKLCFTSIHTDGETACAGLSFQNIDSFAVKNEVSWDIPSAPSNASELEGATVTVSDNISSMATESKLPQLKRVIRFLKNKMCDGDIKKLSVDNLKDYLETYPNLRVIRGLDGEDYKFVVKCMHDSIVGNGFEKSFEEIYDQEANSDFLEGMLSSLGKMSFEEAGETIFDGSSDFSETLTRVGGWIEPKDDHKQVVSGSARENEESTVVKGSFEDLAADQKHKTVIKGGNKLDLPDNEVVASFSKEEFANRAKDLWEVKKLGLAQKVREEVEKIRQENPSVERVSELIRLVVASELKIDSNDCEHFVEGLIDSSSDKLAPQKFARSSEEVREELQNFKHQLEMNKRDDQIKRMKRIIDSMKGQLAEKLAETREAESQERSEAVQEGREWQSKLNTLELENQELKRNLRAMEIKQQSSEAAIETNPPPAESEEPAEETISRNVAEEIIEREREKAEKEIEELSGKVQVAENRIEVMSAKLEEERRANAEAASQKVAAESRSNMTTAAMSKFKARAETLERKVRQLEESLAQKEAECEELKSQQASNGASNPAELEEKNKEQQAEIATLQNNLNESETNLKGALLKVKQLEQKTKFMSSQLEAAQKASRRGGAGAGGGASTQQLEHKIKQLETMNKKVGAASQKLNDELTDKKKEVFDLKKEITLLQNKIKELERKSDKKAA